MSAMLFFLCLMTAVGLGDAAALDHRQASSSSVPDYFQTTPEIYAGPTKTAEIAPFLAQTNSAPFGTASFAPNAPLETGYAIPGNTNNSNIFEMMGQLSSYFPNPVGFGVDEYHLPPNANITTANLLHRHGARYPTGDSSVSSFGSKVENITQNGTATWTGGLSFLNTWKYTLGAEILVARGRQELFDSGVLFYYNYGHLYNTSTKLISRTTTQDRMLKSAEYFMAGFFGLEWTQNATLETIIEQSGFNNSLAGYYQCNNSNNYRSTGGNNASVVWENIYLANATTRFRALSGDYNWTVADSYNAQTLCPYETVAYGYSNWCNLFTYEEWQGFEYSIDLQFQGNDGFLSPTGRGVGIGYVEELYARLQGHLYNLAPGATNVNRTLDTVETTFPLNQSLYMDFSHDTNIYSILTAFGMTQFSDQLANDTITPNRNVTVSHITPFGARVVWEQITTPQPLKAQRPTSTNATMSDFYDQGNTTHYIHMTIGQRTVPLGYSYPECAMRDDGWCEMSTYLNHLGGLLEQARYDYSCFGNYSTNGWLNVTDGVPATKRGLDLGLKPLGGGMGSGLEMKRSSDSGMYQI
ncbi:hypothetical protein LTR70_004806 [Exophiala xenobiotica]|uniref:3-phytase n=1 Tax=Lithohypha guttulata TaxID=1690604 RepID=A0ABR0KCR9_9EURO|nr:hypothetical protein LTR24_004298 [Lithohypha guttulata]KAK5319896.1 hypothetical protein LTR70_004806 [Exophiala xenobiotica]